MNTAIETNDLTCRFGDFTAVDRLNLTIEEGSVYGFLGPNGSGKSTAIRMLLGILTSSSGTARVLGLDIAKDREALRHQTGYMSQKFSLYRDLTVRENLEFYAGMYGLRGPEKSRRIAAMLALADLEARENVLTETLSGGVRQRLALGCAILHRPKLLFLDEPTGGVDPKARRLFWDIIYALSTEGTTILVTTHFMDEAEHCDAIGFIYRGKLCASGAPDVLKQSITGRLVKISSDDAFGLLASLKAQNTPFRDAYIHGSALHILIDEADLSALRSLSYEMISPAMEDVFAYYVKLQTKEERI